MEGEHGYRRIDLGSPLPSGGGALSPHELASDAGVLAELARRMDAAMPEALKTAFALLRLNILSALHVTNAFQVDDDGRTPAGSPDETCDPAWWHAARTVAGLAWARDIALLSYLCENDGRLFVHLTPSPGDDRAAQKSRSKLNGHTDASVLPLPDEVGPGAAMAPSPDVVILACLRNAGGTQTRIAPLSAISAGLDSDTIRLLQEPLFDFRPQASFSMDPGFVIEEQAVLTRDQDLGLVIRFSHSNVTARTTDADAALLCLKSAIAAAFGGVALKPGDVLFVNNRTALHGRSDVIHVDGTPPRWLLRTYGTYARDPTHAPDPSRPYALLPRGRGDELARHG